MTLVKVKNKRDGGSLFHYAHFICDCLFPEVLSGIPQYHHVFRLKNLDQTLGNFDCIYDEVFRSVNIELCESGFNKIDCEEKTIERLPSHENISDFKKFEMDRLQLNPYDEKRELYSSDPHLCALKRDYQKINPNLKYSICMQPSLWDKNFILEVLKPNYSPWEFEILGSKYCKSNNLFIDNSIKKHIYFNAARKLNKLNFTRVISFLDRVINKLFYKDKKFKLSKGWNDFKNKNHLEEIS